jgi:hypothetical protein
LVFEPFMIIDTYLFSRKDVEVIVLCFTND